MSRLTETGDIKYFSWNTEHFIVDNTSRWDEKEVTFEFNEQGTRYVTVALGKILQLSIYPGTGMNPKGVTEVLFITSGDIFQSNWLRNMQLCRAYVFLIIPPEWLPIQWHQTAPLSTRHLCMAPAVLLQNCALPLHLGHLGNGLCCLSREQKVQVTLVKWVSTALFITSKPISKALHSPGRCSCVPAHK